MAGLLGLAVLPGAAGPASARPEPGSSPGASALRQVTLVTGDRVLMGRRVGGPRAVRVLAGPGRGRTAFRTMVLGGHAYVLPADAMPLIGQGRLDRRLFDIDQLIAWRYDDAHRRDIPVIAERPGPGSPAPLRASTTTAALPALGMEAMSIDKARASAAWASLTQGARRGALSAGITRLWLDGKRSTSLDKSVPRIGAPAAWRQGLTGKGATVAVLDTGYDPAHPDLRGVVAHARGFTGRSDDVADTIGHGTHVASIVAGSGGASRGRYRGVAPSATIASGKVFDGEGNARDSWILAAMEWATLRVKARIVNLSLGAPDVQGADPLEKAINALTARTGALFVVAAGNEGRDGDRTVSSPATADAALAVGAAGYRDRPANSSGRGPRLGDFAVKPELTGPGVDIVAARAKGSPIGTPVGAHYQRLSGTSMAAPHVAGAAAILAQQHPDWTAGRLKAALIGAARPGPAGQVFRQGAGRVDLGRAMAQPVTTDTGNLSTYLRWPRPRPVTHTITYTSRSATPVTLKLAVSAARYGGGKAPTGLFRLDRPTVRVPVGGTAKLRITVTPSGVRPGAYAGMLDATAGNGTGVRVLLGAYVEPKAHDLRVRVLDRSGRPADALLTLSSEADGSDELVWADRGSARLRAPAGRHQLHGGVDLGTADCSPWMMVHQPVELTAARTVTFDARKAKQTRMTLDEPGARNVHGLEVGYHYRGGKLDYTELHGAASCPPETAYVLPVRQRGLSFYQRTVWQRQETRLHHFDVYDYRTGGFPSNPVHAAKKKDMATVTATYRAQGVPARGDAVFGVRLPGFSLGWYSRVEQMRLPGTLVLHLTADPRLKWLRELGYSHSWPNTSLAGTPRAFTKGAHREMWNVAVLGPALNAHYPLAIRDRDRDEISYDSAAGLFTDSTPGNDGHDQTATGSVTLASRGRVIAKINSEDRWLIARVPAGPETYTLTTDVKRNGAGLSTGVKVEWTFSSLGAGTGETALPLQVVRWAPRGLDSFNRAKGGTTTQIPLRVMRNHGAPAAKVTTIRVESSGDNGRTWRGLTVRRSGDHWLTSVRNPGTGFVSLRAAVTDVDGNTVNQTILRAYAVHA